MSDFNFQEGEVLLVDKPLGWTSFDVVNKLRYSIKKSLGLKKIKVGHAGTLDPLATGLLIICTGRKTKEIESLVTQEKEYTGSMLLDQHRPSLDLETEIEKHYDLGKIEIEDIQCAAKKFSGEILQEAPAYSAKRINGRKSYELARSGQEVELRRHLIEIYEFDLENIKLPQIDFRLRCSKGTYVRSLARDLGKELGVGGVLSSLRRTRVGDYKIEDSYALEELVKLI